MLNAKNCPKPLHLWSNTAYKCQYFKWDININPQLIINPSQPVTAWQHSPLLLCPQTQPVVTEWTPPLTEWTSRLAVNSITTQRLFLSNEAKAAVPAAAPGAQQNQLKNSIQQLKVLLREWWCGWADKRLSLQTLCVTTCPPPHPPNAPTPAGGRPIRPGLSPTPVATTGNLWKVI